MPCSLPHKICKQIDISLFLQARLFHICLREEELNWHFESEGRLNFFVRIGI